MTWAKPKTLSVVVNTCNRAVSLDKTIRSLFQQAASNIEIVVVNGPSTDGTEEILAKYRGQVKALRCADFNLSVSRNIGIAAASGDVVAFIDDDAFPEPFWAQRLLDAYTNEEVGAVGSHVFDQTGMDYQATNIVCDRYGSAWPKEKHDPSDLYSFPQAFKFSALIGTNSSFRRDLLLAAGGFDEEYEYFLDETDVCVRIIDAGYKVVQIDHALVHHKFLPSHMRNARKATVHHYPILKNTLYFALRYASPQVGVEAALQHGENVYQAHLRDAKWFVEHGELPPEKLSALPGVYARARNDALERYQRSPRYLTADLLRTHATEFLPSDCNPIVESDPLCVVLLCRQYDAVDSGIARFIGVQARSLAALGHTVHVLTLVQSDARIDWEDGVWVHRLTAGWYDDQPATLPFRVHPSQWCYSRAMLDEVRRINARHKVDVIEAPIWDNEAIAFVCSGEFPVVVSLQTSLGIALESHPEWRDDKAHMEGFVLPALQAENYILSNCNSIRGISRAIVDEISSRNKITMPGENIEICNLALEDRASNVVRANQQSLEVFFLGRLELRKGIDVLLDAIPAVLKRVPHARFNLAGDDRILAPDSTETFRQIFSRTHPDLMNRVNFLGKLSDAEVDAQFRSASLFVAPSRFESFGLIYVEAMMFGVPCIGCNTGGVPEVVGESNCGLLVEPEDAIGLANAISCLLKDVPRRRALGKAGRCAYDQRFSPAVISGQLIDVYRRATRKHAAPAAHLVH
ncbi:glycosyltransferase [Paraburkholderia sediminicola]|uniref:glycosyltransferase n=1 Tax=Paraburkholderia sediminicola TaxID=458836 RepID=UPI0038B84102